MNERKVRHLPGYRTRPRAEHPNFEGHLPRVRATLPPQHDASRFEGHLPGSQRRVASPAQQAPAPTQQQQLAFSIRLLFDLRQEAPYTVAEGRLVAAELSGKPCVALDNGRPAWANAKAYDASESFPNTDGNTMYAVQRGNRWFLVAVPDEA